jgi:hypothetical protein
MVFFVRVCARSAMPNGTARKPVLRRTVKRSTSSTRKLHVARRTLPRREHERSDNLSREIDLWSELYSKFILQAERTNTQHAARNVGFDLIERLQGGGARSHASSASGMRECFTVFA